MILYARGDETVKVRCAKCDAPKLGSHKANYTFIEGRIDGKKEMFYYDVRNNGSNFYFRYDGCWYRVCRIILWGIGQQCCSLDLFQYLHETDQSLYTKATLQY